MNKYKIVKAIVLGLLVQLPLVSNALSDKFDGEIKGFVKEKSTGQEMAYTNVALYSSIDSTLIGGTITDDKGLFVLRDVSKGDFYLELNFIGFEKRVIEHVAIGNKSRKVDLGDIYLQSAAEIIDDVTIVAEKSKISYQIDKKVISVSKDLNSIGGTAINVLENAPSIQTDIDGNIQIRGSSDFTVLINGKPSLLKGNDALQQIPSSSIDKIEIITNPSARYDPDGKAGIINVITKKDGMKGMSGFVNVSADTDDKYSGNAMLNLNMGKINLFTGLDYSDLIFSKDLDFERRFYEGQNTTYVSSKGLMKNLHSAFIYKAGIDYYLNENNEFNFSGNFGERNYDNSSYSQFRSGETESSLNSYGKTYKYTDVFGDIWEIYSRYLHKFGEDSELSFSGQYESWDGYDAEDLEEQVTNADYSLNLGFEEKHRYKKSDDNNQLLLKVDYSCKPNEKSNIEFGYQFKNNRREELFIYEDYVDGAFVPNELFRNDLKYKRAIHSFYASYSTALLGAQFKIGLRAEATNRDISISNESAPYKFESHELFPTLHVSRQLTESQHLQISYSRRVRRPNSWILNNNPRWLDSKNVFYGDPLLQPEYADSYELSYRKVFSAFSVNMQYYYRKTMNTFSTLRYLANEGNDIVYHKQVNANKSSAMGIEIGANINPTKWWQINYACNFYKYHLEGEANGNTTDNKNVTWDTRLSSSFKLKHNLRLQFNGFYSASYVDLSGEREPIYTVNISASKEMGPVTIGLITRDLLGSMKFKYKTESNYETTSYVAQGVAPIFNVNVSYKFNNYRQKKRRIDSDADYRGDGF